jgi:hypothetical protein
MSLLSNLKRENETDEQNNSDDSELSLLEKRLDKLRYFGGLGKRARFDKTIFLKDNSDFVKKSRYQPIDRYRYLGNIGK